MGLTGPSCERAALVVSCGVVWSEACGNVWWGTAGACVVVQTCAVQLRRCLAAAAAAGAWRRRLLGTVTALAIGLPGVVQADAAHEECGSPECPAGSSCHCSVRGVVWRSSGK